MRVYLAVYPRWARWLRWAGERLILIADRQAKLYPWVNETAGEPTKES